MKFTAEVTLSLPDWIRVIHALDSSLTRKHKRGDARGAVEMHLIAKAIIRQVDLQQSEKPKASQ